MLRNKSRKAVSNKQGPMANDNTSFPSPTNPSISSLLGSPKIFNGLLSRSLSDVDSERFSKTFDGHLGRSLSDVSSSKIFNGLLARSLSDVDSGISPKSILDNRQMFNLANPFGYDRNCGNTNKKHSTKEESLELEGIKLALLDEEAINACSKPNCRMVLFGTELKVQTSATCLDCPNSATDFGIKTRDSQLLFGSGKQENDSSKGFADGLSWSEIENSEDYTCVITHGPNPKTTHIFDNCVVDNYCVFGNLKMESQCSCLDLPQGKDISLQRRD